MEPYLTATVTLVHVLAAARVTGHALLTKADSRAAVAWIGLAWLSPLIGSAIYAVFGVNRVARKATKLRQQYTPDHATPESGRGGVPNVPGNLGRLAAVGREVTGRRLTTGNHVEVLERGADAKRSMLTAVENAEQSVALASYIFQADAVGRAFVEALSRAHDRGVAVRVLIDGVGGGYLTYPILRRLRRHRVPTATFLHSWRPWRMPFVNMRNHKKLLIIDGTYAFTGGMNIADHTMDYRPRVMDTHIRLRGPVVRHLMQAFADDWNFTTGESLSQGCWWPALERADSIAARAVTSGPDEDMGALETMLGAAIVEARESIRIVTPYFLPDRHLQMALSLAALRGVMVDIIIPARSNKQLIDWASRANLQFLTGEAWRVFLTPPPFDHSKLMTVDGSFCLVGSSNWDARSHRLNFELDVEAYDRDLTAKIDEAIDLRVARSQQTGRRELAQRPLSRQIRDAAARLLLPYL